MPYSPSGVNIYTIPLALVPLGQETWPQGCGGDWEGAQEGGQGPQAEVG